MPRTQEVVASSTSLKSRMIRFIFQRGKRASEQRSKSWPSRVECVSTPVQATASCPVSTSLETHDELSRSAPSTLPTSGHMQVKRMARRGSADGESSRAQWRQRQTHCANCERLFFTSPSSFRNATGRFCSLDCKTNLEYMHELQKMMYTKTWESSADCSALEHKEELADATSSKDVRAVDRHVHSRHQSRIHCTIIGHHSLR